MTVSQNLIDNVNDIKTTLNEISVYNLDVKTAIELYYELAKKVNEVINELSRFEGVVSDEVIKQNEKLIYLLGEGLKVQVGLKIDELIKDGTIQDLINNKIFNELNNKIDTFKQEVNEQLNTIAKDVILISSKIAHKNKNIKLIGDSITAGVGGTGYATDGEEISGGHKVNTKGYCWANEVKKYFETYFRCNVKNYGINGLNSRQLASNIADFIRAEDNIVICCIGTNNRLLEQGMTYLEEDIKTIYNYCKNNNKEIIFMSNIPASAQDENGEINGTKYSKMHDVDNLIMKVCSELSIEYISLYKLISDYIVNKGISLANCLTSDGLHPNDYGYSIIYEIVMEKLGFADRRKIDNANNNYYLETPSTNNADDFLQSGRYIVNVNSTNFPLLSSTTTSSSTEGELQVYNYKNSNSYVLQTYYGLWGGIAQRSKVNGTWGSWYEIEGDTGWEDLTLESGFTSRGADFKPQFRKVGKTVYLRGQITGNFTTSSTPVFQLPAGYRPTMEHVFRAFHENNYLTGNIIKNGYLSAIANTNFSGYLVLDYITPFLVV